jgi:transcriptional regulator with XRE-family HTH domain
VDTGEALRRLRLVWDIPARELAAATGKSRSYVAGVELGKVPPSDDYIAACETFFRIPAGGLSPLSPVPAQVDAVSSLLETARDLPRPLEVAAVKQRRTEKVRLRSHREIDEVFAYLLSPHGDNGEVRHGRPCAVLATLRNDDYGRARILPEDLLRTLTGALTSGIDVEHLVRLDLDHPFAAQDISAMLPLLTLEGRYEPFTVAADQTCAFNVLAVPGRGVLLYGDESGYFHAQEGALEDDLFLEHAMLVRRTSSQLFVRYRHHVPEENLHRYVTTAALERQRGDCFLVSNRLSTFARPSAYWQHDQQRRQRHAGWLDEKLSALRAFELDVRNHSYMEIASLPALKHFVERGRFADDRSRSPSAPVSDRRMILEHLLTLLTSSGSKYELCLETDPRETGVTQNSWTCRKNRTESSVLLFAKGPTCAGMHAEVRSPRLAEFFQIQFQLAWTTLKSSSLDAAATVRWLREQIDGLDKSGD